MDYKVTDTELTSVANAIRTKGGTSALLEWPDEYISAVNAIPTGGGKSGVIVVATEPYASVVAEKGQTQITGTADSEGGCNIAVSETGIYNISAYNNGTLIGTASVNVTLDYSASIGVTPTFADASPTMFTNLLIGAHNGEIDLQQDLGWAVGDVRTIPISAFNGNTASFAAQNIDIVITSFDDYNGCGCVLQFDFKDALSPIEDITNATDVLMFMKGYSTWEVYTTTLPNLVQALPQYLRSLLINFSVTTNQYDDGWRDYTISNNLLALRRSSEVINGMPYYSDTTNRIKSIGHGGVAGAWMLRGNVVGGGPVEIIKADGSQGEIGYPAAIGGIAPFGCI